MFEQTLTSNKNDVFERAPIRLIPTIGKNEMFARTLTSDKNEMLERTLTSDKNELFERTPTSDKNV
jgi:hypothetical protein